MLYLYARGPQPWKPGYRHKQMSVLASAVGALLAAILESSVLTHLAVGGIMPDLVFAVGIAVAMVLGFDAGMTWAVAGGVMLDILLPERVLGSTALTLVLVIGLALLVARATWPPRLSIIATTAFALSLVYQILILVVLAVTSGVSWAGSSVSDLFLTAVLNVVIAVPAVLVVRALDLRFGEPERVAW